MWLSRQETWQHGRRRLLLLIFIFPFLAFSSGCPSAAPVELAAFRLVTGAPAVPQRCGRSAYCGRAADLERYCTAYIPPAKGVQIKCVSGAEIGGSVPLKTASYTATQIPTVECLFYVGMRRQAPLA